MCHPWSLEQTADKFRNSERTARNKETPHTKHFTSSITAPEVKAFGV